MEGTRVEVDADKGDALDDDVLQRGLQPLDGHVVLVHADAQVVRRDADVFA